MQLQQIVASLFTITQGDRQPRVSLWEIKPLTTFPMYPSPFPFRLERPWAPGLSHLHGIKDDEIGINSTLMWLRGDGGDQAIQSLNFLGFGVTPWIQPRLDASVLSLQPEMYQAMAAAADRLRLLALAIQVQRSSWRENKQ